jgi:site-specific DNA-adenine methylase
MRQAHLSDVRRDLIDWWLAVQNKSIDLDVVNSSITKEEFLDLRECPDMTASEWWLVLRHTYGQIMRPTKCGVAFGPYRSKPYGTISRDDLASMFRMLNRAAVDTVIERCSYYQAPALMYPHSVIYCDPPYAKPGGQTDYGMERWRPGHTKLFWAWAEKTSAHHPIVVSHRDFKTNRGAMLSDRLRDRGWTVKTIDALRRIGSRHGAADSEREVLAWRGPQR